MITLWLDQFAWIELARDEAASGQLATSFLQAVGSGRLRPVLSAGNYLELWNRRRAKSRHEVAELMRRATSYITLAPAHLLAAEEVHVALGSIDAHDRTPAFGYGVRHAFAHDMGRLRLVKSITDDGQPGTGLPTPPEWIELADRHPEVFEWWSLAGPDHDLPRYADGVEIQQPRCHEVRFAEDLNSILTRLRRIGAGDDRLRDAAFADYFVSDILDTVNDACRQLDASAPSRVLSSLPPDPSIAMSDRFRAFVEQFAIHHVIVTLIESKTANPQAKWTPHDLNDIAGVSSAIIHCDVVIADREWAHHVRMSELHQRHATRVLDINGLAELCRQ